MKNKEKYANAASNLYVVKDYVTYKEIILLSRSKRIKKGNENKQNKLSFCTNFDPKKDLFYSLFYVLYFCEAF